MKRKLILLVVTIVFLVGFGVILHSPPSMIDAVTGATPKSKKAAQASAQLEGSYVLGINMMSDGLDNENTRNKLKELALDDSETNETRTYPQKLFVVTAIPKGIIAIPNNSILIPFIANTFVTNLNLECAL